ncbi:hypothetical protein [Pseudolysinimonas yzui]|uniref:Uncharacterized protein n=1 Tax=Pseudolysinimonas yzui TaxID=2708254 RepID=A0A8J3M2R9_9MICO|nr:hypothetical protein [Pseudolysinimonas yzui]GHF24718.1 hypothetical protein GCM10011600_27310 [Pseudolysinimonas yzui]
MDRGWFRSRWMALTSVALAVAAVGVDVAEQAARAAVPPPHPEDPYPLWASNEELQADGLWVLHVVVALASFGFGLASVALDRGRALGAAAAAAAVVVLVL